MRKHDDKVVLLHRPSSQNTILSRSTAALSLSPLLLQENTRNATTDLQIQYSPPQTANIVPLYTSGKGKAPQHADAARSTPREILYGGAVNVDGGATTVKAHELIPALGPHPAVVARLLAQRRSQTLVRDVPASTTVSAVEITSTHSK